jgi:hypothetical protein
MPVRKTQTAQAGAADTAPGFRPTDRGLSRLKGLFMQNAASEPVSREGERAHASESCNDFCLEPSGYLM